jgi:hypothetical protein
MAVIKYDVSGVEAGGGGEQPQPGLYKGKIVSVTPRKKKSNGDPTNDLEVVVDVGKEYSRLWTYIQLDNPASAWKLREFTDALGLPDKGGLLLRITGANRPAPTARPRTTPSGLSMSWLRRSRVEISKCLPDARPSRSWRPS